jgi:hypothetical protein
VHSGRIHVTGYPAMSPPVVGGGGGGGGVCSVGCDTCVSGAEG